MQSSDQFVRALIALCKREGGHRNVAAVARVSPENLWQIINFTKLPSGNPRGVGPAVRRKLDEAYPDWLASGKGLPSDDEATNAEAAAGELSAPAQDERQALALSLILQIGQLLAPLDGADREQAEVLLRKLALDPEQAEQWGTKLARLVGSVQGQPAAKPTTRPATEGPPSAHRRLLDSLPQRLGAPFQGDFHDADRRKKGEGR